jgi:hypothetical protein
MIILLTVTSLFFKTRLRVLYPSRISYVKRKGNCAMKRVSFSAR